MSRQPVRILLLAVIAIAVVQGRNAPRLPQWEHADETTQMARKLLLERIDDIAQNPHCRQTFGEQKIDIDLLRLTARQTRFYDATAPEGGLKFSAVVGKPASPDDTLRMLASGVMADAFVLGYCDADRYVRTRQVVLTRGYLQQPDSAEGTLRPTTREEKQSLLLHEILRIALRVDDDDLNGRGLCPLQLLAFCPRHKTADPVKGGAILDHEASRERAGA